MRRHRVGAAIKYDKMASYGKSALKDLYLPRDDFDYRGSGRQGVYCLLRQRQSQSEAGHECVRCLAERKCRELRRQRMPLYLPVMRRGIPRLLACFFVITSALSAEPNFNFFQGCTCTETLTKVNKSLGVSTREVRQAPRPEEEIEIRLATPSFAEAETIVVDIRLTNKTKFTHYFGTFVRNLTANRRGYYGIWLTYGPSPSMRRVRFCPVKFGEIENPAPPEIPPSTQKEIRLVNFVHQVDGKWVGVSEKCPLKPGAYEFTLVSPTGFLQSVEFAVQPSPKKQSD